MNRNEAIEIVRDYYPSSGKDLNEALETLIPELKESEDETIRKELVGFIQDEIDSINRLVSGDYDDRDADDIAHQKWCEKALAWIKKQGEHKPVISDEAIREGVAHFGITQYQINNWPKKYVDVEKQDEKNELRKIEPKFKVGDWVINTITKEVEQVIDIIDSEYICSGHLIVSFNNQHILKRWTIQDAKDGDVLSSNDGHGNDSIELIKSITDKKIEFWFCLTNGNRYEVFDGITPYTNLASREDATPATEEQRDKLEKAITKAGYKWDVEKMELKTIEQEQAIDCLADVSRDNWEFVHEFVEKFGRIPKDEDELNALVEYVLKRQKPNTWSEEDEHRITDTIYFLDTAKKHYACTEELDNCIEWLKSLKGRYTWKPSDEQMEYLAKAITTLGNEGDNKTSAILCELRTDLKKLTE